MKDFQTFLNEAKMQVGSWLKQEISGGDIITYGYVYKELKNKGFQAVTIQDYGGSITGQAASKSTKNWHPTPIVIDKSEVPAKAVKKIEAKADKLNVEIM